MPKPIVEKSIMMLLSVHGRATTWAAKVQRDNEDPAHGGDSRFCLVRLGPVSTDHLAHPQLLQAADDYRAQQER